MPKSLFILICLIPLIVFSQNEAAKWYFGNKAALDFMTSPPTALANSSLHSIEGCASIADATGNLLFYTNSDTIWNQAHQVMANGLWLFGNTSSVQSSLIVKQPGASDLYYVFTQAGNLGGLYYSIVDMSLSAGMGSVTVKNASLYPLPCKEGLSAVKHCNGYDVWIMVHESTTNNFRAFLLTASGVSTVPVISSVGLTMNLWQPSSFKLSPDGKKLAFINVNVTPSAYSFELFDFNNVTGMVSNPLLLVSNTALIPLYGCEFSPDASKLYVSALTNAPKILQWDLCAGSPAAIAASQYSINVPSLTPPYGMQAAPDNKIYISSIGEASLHVINSPDLPGAACNFVASGLSIAPGFCYLDLPNFVSSLIKPTFLFAPGTVCASGSFTSPVFVTVPGSGCAPSNNPVVGLQWLFGDSGSGAANSSTLATPVHNYPGPGTYSVQLIINYGSCPPDTLRKNIVITTPALQGNFTSTLSCTTATAAISVSGGSGNYTYVWSPGAQTGTTVSGLTPGAHTVTVNDAGNLCSAQPTIQLSTLPFPALNVSGNFTICTGEAAKLSASGANTYTWSNAVVNPSVGLSPTVTTVYSVTASHTLNTCTAQKVVTVTVLKCTGLFENTKERLVKIYPNPNSGIFFIETTENVSLGVYDPLGKLVFQSEYEVGKHSIDLEKLEAGLYFIKTTSEKNTNNFTVVRSK